MLNRIAIAQNAFLARNASNRRGGELPAFPSNIDLETATGAKAMHGTIRPSAGQGGQQMKEICFRDVSSFGFRVSSCFPSITPFRPELALEEHFCDASSGAEI